MRQPSSFLIQNAHIFCEQGDWSPGWLLTGEGRIHNFGAGDPPEGVVGNVGHVLDARGNSLLPGFIDIHFHGCIGFDVMDASPDGFRKMAAYVASHGVTSFLPTTWSAGQAKLLEVLGKISGLAGSLKGGASILGVHMEGPYLNPAKAGAHNTEFIRRAEEVELKKFIDTGIIRIMTLAPEFPENLGAIDECVRRGVTVSIGHSTSVYDQVKNAVNLGLKHATHTFNAMGSFGHREPGTAGAVMAIPGILCELISDNIHVHAAAQKILVETKGTEGVVLVTDAICGTGLADGEYRLDGRPVFIQGGAARLADGTLAGSTLTMERALKNVMEASGIPLGRGWPMSSLNAARQIGLSETKGSIEVGKDADLVLLDNELNVVMTLVGGEVVYSA